SLACATLTTTVGVINGVHSYTTYAWTATAPARCTGFTNLTQAVVFVADTTNCRATINMNATNLTRAQAQLSVGTITGQKYSARTSGASDLFSFALTHV